MSMRKNRMKWFFIVDGRGGPAMLISRQLSDDEGRGRVPIALLRTSEIHHQEKIFFVPGRSVLVISNAVG